MSEPEFASILAVLEQNLESVIAGLEGAKAEMEAAVEAEREACAQLVEDELYGETFAEQVAAAIRARGAK